MNGVSLHLLYYASPSRRNALGAVVRDALDPTGVFSDRKSGKISCCGDGGSRGGSGRGGGGSDGGDGGGGGGGSGVVVAVAVAVVLVAV